MYEESLSSFKDRHINQALISIDDNYLMYWQVDNQWYVLQAVGDCCSFSWYEHCDGGSNLQDAKLLDFEDIDIGTDEAKDEYDVIKVNMLKFKTSKGYCTIEFRNSSNGYYSGSCELDKCSLPDMSKLKVLDDF